MKNAGEITMSSKRQIALPAALCNALGLVTGSKFRVAEDGQGGILLKPLKKTSIDNLLGILHRPNQPAMSARDMDNAIMDVVAADDARIRGYQSSKRNKKS